MKKTGKLIAIGKKGQYYRIGESFDKSEWFAVTPESKVDTTAQKRDTVEVEYEVGDKNQNIVTTIVKIAGAPQAKDGTLLPPTEYQRPKTPAEIAGIRSQAIGKMVAQSLSALQGQIDLNNIHQVIKELYKTYDELIK